MNFAIVGSRGYKRLDLVRDLVEDFPLDSVVVSGGARGVDTAAEDAAREFGLEAVILRADWERHGRGAGFIRNHDIVARADHVYAFWDGESRGTLHSIRLAAEARKPFTVFGPDGEEIVRESWE